MGPKERIVETNLETCFVEIPPVDAAGWLSGFIVKLASDKSKKPAERLLYCRCCQIALRALVDSIDKESLTEDERKSLSVSAGITIEERFRGFMEETLTEAREEIASL